jgi:short-subunit dehydrogenase
MMEVSMEGGKGRTALITGASSGIGLELAREFAAHGHDLVLVARSASRLEDIAAELKRAHAVDARVLVKDLSLPTAAEDVHREVTGAGLVVEVLVNNAGFGVYGRFVETEWERELEMLRLNVVALTDLTKRFARDMIARRRGRVLNVASTAAFQPGPHMAVYYASKAYVLSFSEALADELRGTGVTVTTLCPGPTRSGFQAVASMHRARMLRLSMMDAASVARIGYRAVMAGRPTVIAGWLNRLVAFSVRLAPRQLVTRISRWISEPV